MGTVSIFFSVSLCGPSVSGDGLQPRHVPDDPAQSHCTTLRALTMWPGLPLNQFSLFSERNTGIGRKSGKEEPFPGELYIRGRRVSPAPLSPSALDPGSLGPPTPQAHCPPRARGGRMGGWRAGTGHVACGAVARFPPPPLAKPLRTAWEPRRLGLAGLGIYSRALQVGRAGWADSLPGARGDSGLGSQLCRDVMLPPSMHPVTLRTPQPSSGWHPGCCVMMLVLGMPLPMQGPWLSPVGRGRERWWRHPLPSHHGQEPLLRTDTP